ncbi:hypothetical protein AMATHDRAFT_59537 [Amanita thiersii Skay4041]|uniref:Uncharacterized protein n=1 Tax=Amanita thiersii Skay4041 TaxID=703135 RepID=A0A2A9NL04_9AGAR|nr:hypothetical protein AMATHDRAFT_59537 [Amanita thiersii Skay4041]
MPGLDCSLQGKFPQHHGQLNEPGSYYSDPYPMSGSGVQGSGAQQQQQQQQPYKHGWQLGVGAPRAGMGTGAQEEPGERDREAMERDKPAPGTGAAGTGGFPGQYEKPSEPTKSGTGEHHGGHRHGIGERIVGTAEKAYGKMTGDRERYERGQEHTTRGQGHSERQP